MIAGDTWETRGTEHFDTLFQLIDLTISFPLKSVGLGSLMPILQNVGHAELPIFSQLGVRSSIDLYRFEKIVQIGVVRDRRYHFVWRRFKYLLIHGEFSVRGALKEVPN
jgi:hypothetical protein